MNDSQNDTNQEGIPQQVSEGEGSASLRSAGSEASPLHTAVRDLCRSYERGLDVAGADSDASFFDYLTDALDKGETTAVSTLLEVFDRYGSRNGNHAVAAEFLDAAIRPLRAHEALVGALKAVIAAQDKIDAYTLLIASNDYLEPVPEEIDRQDKARKAAMELARAALEAAHA